MQARHKVQRRNADRRVGWLSSARWGEGAKTATLSKQFALSKRSRVKIPREIKVERRELTWCPQQWKSRRFHHFLRFNRMVKCGCPGQLLCVWGGRFEASP